MSRKIEFRGKDLASGKWCYGSYMSPICDGEHPFIYVKTYCNNHWEYISHQVNPLTVGQYTGKDDKDGIKIFEGDILRVDGLVMVDNQYVPTYYYGKVFWCESDCSFSVSIYRRVVDGDVGFVGGAIYMLSESDLESSVVIGNIYDNPKLLVERM